ncbi:YdgA family protein [Pelomonas sp. KK5]|uniref:YdgA family protein n=1 Tax=Pelomonas sp. KK5 TaxID=1855730 RepID=UPI0009F8E0B6|nr:DUF945 family protein [Pelomonas sp. KK5]
MAISSAAKVATGVAVVGVAWLGLTWFTGRSFEQGYDAQLAEAQKKYPFLKLTELHKDTGLTGGRYGGKLQFACGPAAGAQPLTVAFEHEVQYGPFPGFRHVGAAHVSTRVSAEPGFKVEGIQSSYGYGGGFDTSWRLPAGAQALPGEQGKLAWSDMDIAVSGRRDGSQLRYRWAAPEFTMAFAGSTAQPAMGAGSMTMKGLLVEGESSGSNLWLRPGTQSVAIDHLESHNSGPGGTSVGMVMDKLAIKGGATLAQELMDVQGSYTIGKISVSPGAGQPIELANMDLQLSLKRLEVAAIEKAMQQFMDSLGQGCGTAKDPQALNAMLMQAVQQFSAAGKTMLLRDPSYSIDKFAVDFGGKRGELSASLAIAGLKQADLDGPPEALSAKVAQLVSASAKGRVPLQWLAAGAQGLPPEQAKEQAELVAASVVQRGMAQRDGEFLASSFSFAKGEAQVNGKTVWQVPPQQ